MIQQDYASKRKKDFDWSNVYLFIGIAGVTFLLALTLFLKI